MNYEECRNPLTSRGEKNAGKVSARTGRPGARSLPSMLMRMQNPGSAVVGARDRPPPWLLGRRPSTASLRPMIVRCAEVTQAPG